MHAPTVTDAPPARKMRFRDVVLCVVFLCFVFAPLVDNVFRIDPAPPVVEKRQLAPLPRWSLAKAANGDLPRAFETWFNDHFGFRDFLLRVSSAAKVCVFAQSPTSEASVGTDGWLYLSGVARELHRAEMPFRAEDLAGWQKVLEGRRDLLESRGAHFLMVLVPEKQTLYPEHLKEEDRQVGARTRTDQLVEHMRAHSDVPLIDLREVLRPHVDEKLFYRTDTHWTATGAWIAYSVIAGMLSTWLPQVAPLTPEQVHPQVVQHRAGDLGVMMSIEGIPLFFEDFEWWWFAPYGRAPGGIARSELELPEELVGRVIPPKTFVTTIAAPAAEHLPRAVIFRDSFTTTLQPLLSCHFKRAVYVGMQHPNRPIVPWSRQLVDIERPDVVVIIVVERALMGDVPAE